MNKEYGDLMQEELPRWFDRMLRGIESSALFVWFMRRRFRGLEARRWVEDWIRGHYPDKVVQNLDCDVCTGWATICVEKDGDHVMVGVAATGETPVVPVGGARRSATLPAREAPMVAGLYGGARKFPAPTDFLVYFARASEVEVGLRSRAGGPSEMMLIYSRATCAGA